MHVFTFPMQTIYKLLLTFARTQTYPCHSMFVFVVWQSDQWLFITAPVYYNQQKALKTVDVVLCEQSDSSRFTHLFFFAKLVLLVNLFFLVNNMIFRCLFYIFKFIELQQLNNEGSNLPNAYDKCEMTRSHCLQWFKCFFFMTLVKNIKL